MKCKLTNDQQKDVLMTTTDLFFSEKT